MPKPMRICGPSGSTATCGDLFALQNEITSRIAVALNLELIGAEAARPTEHPDALDYIFRGRAAMIGASIAGKSYRGNWPVRARIGARSAISRGAELSGDRARRRVLDQSDRHGGSRYRASGSAGRASLGRIAPQPAGAFRQRPGAARAEPVRRGHSRIRNGARVQSQLGGRIARSRPVQALHRVA